METRLLTRCSPRQLVNANGLLTDGQKNAITAVGFGSLLQLKCDVLPRSFLLQLLDDFDPESCSLQLRSGGHHTVTVDDAATILRMPTASTPVPTNSVSNMHVMLSQHFHISRGGISFTTLMTHIRGGLADDTFVRAYILFSLVCFLRPTSKDMAGPRLYAAVEDVHILNMYNWPQFVLDWLVTEVRKYKSRASRSQPSTKASVGGCLYVLMLIYFENSPTSMDMDIDGGIVSLAYWTTERVKERLHMENTATSYLPSQHQEHHRATELDANLMDQGNTPAGPQTSPTKNALEPTNFGACDPTNMQEEVASACEAGPRRSLRRNKFTANPPIQPFNENRPVQQVPSVEPTVPVGDPPTKQQELPFACKAGPRRSLWCNKSTSNPPIQPSNECHPAAHIPSVQRPFEDGDPNTSQQQVASAGKSGPRRSLRRNKSKSSPPIQSSNKSRPVSSLYSPSVEPAVQVGPSVQALELTTQQRVVYDYVMHRPRRRGSQTNDYEHIVSCTGCHIPLIRMDMYESFKPRGRVSNLIFLDQDTPHSRNMVRQYCGEVEVGYDICQCEMWIIPVLRNEHWFCIVIDLLRRTIHVLDSMQGTTNESFVIDLRCKLHDVVVNRNTSCAICDFPIEYPVVPQQCNAHDCGIFVMKFMELWNGVLHASFLQDLCLTREQTLVDMVMDNMNTCVLPCHS